ncbi:hypothetical protein [Bifidobacterium breve]|uniref:hypothetical protein n=1 Tax=Bifidobacterium breve TaxID=1685 RepID=UPI00254D576F|nr:hypothetical protein [Bifidobacterium breve]MDK8732613.1 hypothetical protein [Bifidobacterium breve]MDU1288595.1 hypothetical protein [Bifidobacterium bifidum]
MEEPIQLPKIVNSKTLSSKNLRNREDKASMETLGNPEVRDCLRDRLVAGMRQQVESLIQQEVPALAATLQESYNLQPHEELLRLWLTNELKEALGGSCQKAAAAAFSAGVSKANIARSVGIASNNAEVRFPVLKEPPMTD